MWESLCRGDSSYVPPSRTCHLLWIFQEQVGKLSSDPVSTGQHHACTHHSTPSHPFPALQPALVVPVLVSAQPLSIHKQCSPTAPCSCEQQLQSVGFKESKAAVLESLLELGRARSAFTGRCASLGF